MKRTVVVVMSAVAWTAWGGASLIAQRAVPPQPAEAVPTAPAAEELNVPTGEHWLGTVRIPVDVLADGKPLAAGRYRVRLTGRHAEDTVVGQLATLERWVEFVQGSEVKGAALAPVVPARATERVADSPVPTSGRFRVQRLVQDDYLRLWYNYKGDQILIYLPVRPPVAAGQTPATGARE